MADEAKLMELYALAFAPLGRDTILGEVGDLTVDDVTTDLVVDEITYMDNLWRLGFSKFQDELETYRDVAPSDSPIHVSTTIQCFVAYLKRMQNLSGALLDLTGKLTPQYEDTMHVLKKFEVEVKTHNRRPEGSADIGDVLDMTPNCRWASPEDLVTRKTVGMAVGGGGRVEFKETTRVLTGENQEAEEALKVSVVKRKKQRNPTGYQKFNFKDLGIDEGEVRFDDYSTDSGGGGASSAGGGRESRTSSEGELSTRAIGSDSMSEECRGNEETVPNASKYGRSDSLVAFSFDKDITDPESDPSWADQSRRSQRFSRIRNRVPTGHPSLMKKSSDELSRLIHDLEDASSEEEVVDVPVVEIPPLDGKIIAAFDNETAKNTALNRRTSTALKR